MTTQTLNTTRRISAANLTVPKKPGVAPAIVSPVTSQKPEFDIKAVFSRLQKLIDDCGPKPNKNDLAIVVIEACISEGIDTEQKIVGALARLGLNPKHAAMMLKHHGDARWRRGSDRIYRLLD